MTRFVLRATRLTAAALAALVAGACSDGIDPPQPRPIAVFQVDANGDDATPNETRPSVTVVRAVGLNVADTRNPGDICEVLTFSDQPQPPASFSGVDAGDALSVQLSGTTTSLVPTEEVFGRFYSPPGTAAVAFQPGDSAKVTIPGAAGGFPATTFALKTAEAIVFQPIAVPPQNNTADLTVRWNAGDVNSAMLLSLRYKLATESVTRQVLCLMRDDGEFDIPEGRLTGWQTASSENRTAVATRVRNSGLNLDGATIFGSTTYRKTVPLAP